MDAARALEAKDLDHLRKTFSFYRLQAVHSLIWLVD